VFEDIESFDPLYSEIIENEKKNYGWSTASSDMNRRGSVSSLGETSSIISMNTSQPETPVDLETVMIIPKMSRRRSKSFDDVSIIDAKTSPDKQKDITDASDLSLDESKAETVVQKVKEVDVDNKQKVHVPVQIAPPQPVVYIKGPSAENKQKEVSYKQQLQSQAPKKSSPSHGHNGHNNINHHNNNHQSHAKHHEDSNAAELMRFGLNEHDKVVETYTCALYPRKGLLTHGKMLITQNYIAFSGWPETRVLLAMELIESIEKQNTLMYIPNAISITTATEEYFFGSFIDRDPCYNLLTRLSAVKKKLVEINCNADTEKRKVVLGLQTPKKSDAPLSGVGANLGASIGAVVSGIGRDLGIEIGGDVDSYSRNHSTISQTITHTVIETDDRRNEKTKHVETTKFSDQSYISPSRKIIPSSESPVATAATTAVVSDDIDIISLFNNEKKISRLHDTTIKASYKDFFSKLWKNGQGYEKFLLSEGDLNITCDEWKPFHGTVSEDLNQIPFNYYRNFTYEHPRTTMLMFGPKNAPAKQVQYLYLKQGEGDGLPEARESGQYLVLTVTQFDGIPMAEFFKVLQYWGYSSTNNNNSVKTCVGLYVHFIKTTLLKGQVSSGVKDELTTLAKRWCTFAQNVMDNKVDTIATNVSVKSSTKAIPETITVSEVKTVVQDENVKAPSEGSGWFRIYFYLLLIFTFIIVIASLHIHYKNDRRITDLSNQIKVLSVQIKELNQIIINTSNNMKTNNDNIE